MTQPVPPPAGGHDPYLGVVDVIPWRDELACGVVEGCSGRSLVVWDAASRTWQSVRVGGADVTACLQHAGPEERASYLGSLAPGVPLDLRRTILGTEVLEAISECLEGRYGSVGFEEATFSGDAGFNGATFSGDAWFEGATFSGEAGFGGATFSGDAWFKEATFSGTPWFSKAMFSADAWFEGATFPETPWFSKATFSGGAWFEGATFPKGAWFGGARFLGDAEFEGATFSGVASFDRANFQERWHTSKFSCHRLLSLKGARFDGPVDVHVEAGRVDCSGARWEHSVTLRLNGEYVVNLAELVAGRRGATRLKLGNMVRNVDYPFLVLAPDEFFGSPEAGSEGRAVAVEELSGTDTTRMVLTNVDVSRTRFVDAMNLDLIRLEGRCRYLRTPCPDWGRRSRFLRHTPRSIIEAEDIWRRSRSGALGPGHGPITRPESLSPVYRYLRKSLEDTKDEPGAADFYYGEMEMRRHDATRPWAERVLLTLYWAISGYGLRASRAMSALALVMVAAFALLIMFGIPGKEPGTSTVGYVSVEAPAPRKADMELPDSCRGDEAGRRGRGEPVCRFVVTATEPVDPTVPTGPLPDRFTGERAGKSLEVVSAVSLFNADETELTGLGKVIAFTSRALGTILLGLAILAVRNRVRR
ncbi:pentapeptide repeat-containing protein [Streptomyces sp. NBC_00483]|uniref:pentapeptide repeat-containing protein n=1 Tax=Streptomyces sp. NBC_00483 TaxID=2975756 RepID=UPI002E17E84B